MRKLEKAGESWRKKLLSLAAFSLIIPATIVSCGGGGGSSSESSTTSTSTTTSTTQTTPVTYYGAASQGDLAKFTFDGQKVYYEVSGPVFGDKSGSFPVSVNVQKPFYKGDADGTPVYLMLSGNLAFADVILDGKDTLVVGLRSSGGLTDSDVAGKKFVYVSVLSNGSVGGYTLELGTDHTWKLYDLEGNEEDSGTWQLVNGSYIKATDSSNNTYNVVVKPGTNRAGFVVDLAGSSVSGFGMGLEQKPLTKDDITGTYYYYSYDADNDEDCYGTVKVYYDAGSSAYRYDAKTVWCEDSEDVGLEETGTLTPNSPVDGVAKLTDPEGNEGYVFIDPEDGYFMAVKLKANGDIGEYIIGSSKTE